MGYSPPRRGIGSRARLLNDSSGVLLVKTYKDGMRAEEIRKKLGIQSKEMPPHPQGGHRHQEAHEQGPQEGDDLFRAMSFTSSEDPASSIASA
jgi:hypothetical protein